MEEKLVKMTCSGCKKSFWISKENFKTEDYYACPYYIGDTLSRGASFNPEPEIHIITRFP